MLDRRHTETKPSTGARRITAAATSTTVFVGETERGPPGPTLITSAAEYARLFGSYFRARDGLGSRPQRLLTPYAVDGYFANGGSSAYVLRAMDEGAEGGPRTARRGRVEASSPGIWAHSLSVAFLPSRDGNAERFRLAVVYKAPGTRKRRLVESWDRLSTNPQDANYVIAILERSLYIRWTKGPAAVSGFDALGGPPGTSPRNSDIVKGAIGLTGGTGGGGELSPAAYARLLSTGLAGIDDAALLVASAEALLGPSDQHLDFLERFIAFADSRPRRDMFFVGDLPSVSGDTAAATSSAVAARRRLSASDFASLYWPHVVVRDPAGGPPESALAVPPAGHVAGVFARNDSRRGVWKAPAGVEAALAGTVGMAHQLDDRQNDELSSEGINALRALPGAGRVVWGARTMASDTEWRYVPVRRMEIFLRTSIGQSIRWAAAERSDEPLWASLRASIHAFMQARYRSGAFAGRTSDEAYFVKVDAQTTTQADQAAGFVNIVVGFAPLRPTEFVVLTIRQKTKPAPAAPQRSVSGRTGSSPGRAGTPSSPP